jgi:hypothetical protein
VVRRLLNGPFVHRSRVRLWTQRAALRRPFQQTSVVLGYPQPVVLPQLEHV